MTASAVRTSKAPPPAGPYSQGRIAGPFLFTAGFGPQDPETGEIPDGIADQTRRVIDNLEAVVIASGASLSDVVKTTVHLASLSDFAAFNSAYAERFTEPYPVRTTVQSGLAGILVEIDAVIALPQG